MIYLRDALPLGLLHNVIHPGCARVHIVDHPMSAHQLLDCKLHEPRRHVTAGVLLCRLITSQLQEAEQQDCLVILLGAMLL